MRTRPLLPLAAAAALLLTAGVGYGLLTNRWGQSETLSRAVAALDRVPTTVGGWRSDDVPHDPHELERVGIRGSVWRTYRHEHSGATVTVLVVCGRGGPISVHTPDVCYAGSGYVQAAAQSRVTPAGDRAAFWVAPFDKPDPLVPRRLTVVWGWSQNGDDWVAPENARSVCAWQPALYKVYLVHAVPATSATSATQDPVPAEFLTDFLPPLRAALTGRAP